MLTIHFASRHESGNIFHLLALVRAAMHKARRINEYNDLRDDVLACSSYDEALGIIRQHVTLIDDDDVY